MENLYWVVVGVLFVLSCAASALMMRIDIREGNTNTLAAILLRKLGVLK